MAQKNLAYKIEGNTEDIKANISIEVKAETEAGAEVAEVKKSPAEIEEEARGYLEIMSASEKLDFQWEHVGRLFLNFMHENGKYLDVEKFTELNREYNVIRAKRLKQEKK